MSFFFIQMADPQFGLFSHVSGLSAAEIEALHRRGIPVRPAPKISGFADETRLYGKAIDEANRLRPDFVVMCGDMVNDSDDEAQLDELWRITGLLDDDIPMHWVAGNHDVGNELTPESLATYRRRFGEDNFFFDHGGSRFVVLNSNVAYDPRHVPEEWERQVDFLRDALVEARRRDSDHVVVFTHHPLFLREPDEDDSIFVVPQARKTRPARPADLIRGRRGVLGPLPQEQLRVVSRTPDGDLGRRRLPARRRPVRLSDRQGLRRPHRARVPRARRGAALVDMTDRGIRVGRGRHTARSP